VQPGETRCTAIRSKALLDAKAPSTHHEINEFDEINVADDQAEIERIAALDAQRNTRDARLGRGYDNERRRCNMPKGTV
jgi:hypothetical protein